MNEGAVKLRQWRKSTGMGQMDAAVMFKMHVTQLSMFECGKRLPTRAQALRFRDEAGVPVDAWDKPAADTGDSEPSEGHASGNGGKAA